MLTEHTGRGRRRDRRQNRCRCTAKPQSSAPSAEGLPRTGSRTAGLRTSAPRSKQTMLQWLSRRLSAQRATASCGKTGPCVGTSGGGTRDHGRPAGSTPDGHREAAPSSSARRNRRNRRNRHNPKHKTCARGRRRRVSAATAFRRASEERITASLAVGAVVHLVVVGVCWWCK